MLEETVDPKFLIESLVEANETLQEEVTHLRDTNRLLRNVNGAQRRALESQRRQLELAAFNDNMFKEFCAVEIGATVASPDEGGLPKPRYVVEPLIASDGEASAPSTPHERTTD
jgi:hypothetical protein